MLSLWDVSQMVCTVKHYYYGQNIRTIPSNCLMVGFHVLWHSKNNNQLPGEYFHCETANQKKTLFYPWCLEGSLSDTWSLTLPFHRRKCYNQQKIMFFSAGTLITISLISQLKVSCGSLLWCVPLEWSGSGSGSLIQDHSDHGTSKEMMNPLQLRIHQLP